jgi:hypothetical protein
MAHNLDEDQRARLDAEWAFLNATREMMNIARQKPDSTTYNQAIYLGEVIAPSVLGRDKRLLHGIKESAEARLFREKAVAETAIRGKVVTALDVLEEELRSLTTQAVAVPEGEMIQNRLAIVQRVHQELKPKKVSENQIIFRDAIKTNRHLPVSDYGTDSVEYVVDETRALRITVLHPDPPEHKIGADLIYEFRDTDKQTVRVAFLQYKMWDGKTLQYDPRMINQLDRLMGVGCRGQLCLSPGGDDIQRTYRFPYCSVFLRPTDRLQDPNATLKSSGLHVPLCVVQKSWVQTDRGATVVRRDSMESQSISHEIFEYLFVCGFIGSRVISAAELTEYYRKWGILELDERIILHAQEFDTLDKTLEAHRIKPMKQPRRTKFKRA